MRWNLKIRKPKFNKSPIAQLPSLGEATNEPLQIKQVRSTIGCLQGQVDAMRGLGLRGIGKIVERPKDATTLGLLRKVQHLVEITPISAAE
ncbi:MAG: 50S ribosomal protein L30 [Prochlorotrichaceae cyanobacterium]|jgi:large subunit ribosomal protein L30